MNIVHRDRSQWVAGMQQPQQEGLAFWLLAVARRVREHAAGARVRAAERQMKVVETLGLGGRRQLLLIECAGERFLVGTGPESVQTITRIGGAAMQSAGDEASQCL